MLYCVVRETVARLVSQGGPPPPPPPPGPAPDSSLPAWMTAMRNELDAKKAKKKEKKEKKSKSKSKSKKKEKKKEKKQAKKEVREFSSFEKGHLVSRTTRPIFEREREGRHL